MSDNGRSARPAVTVAVAAYNCEAYVGECIDSLKRQTLTDFEAIVVDDKSTDGTVEAAREAIAGDERFTLICSERNEGPGAARNKAIDRARGEFFMYVDSDDRLVADALEKLVARARAQELDELIFSARSFHENASVMALMDEDFSGREPFEGVGTGREMLVFHSDRGQYYAPGALRMARLDLLEREGIRFPEGIIHEDELYSFFIAATSTRSSFLDEPLYLRRQRAGSIMGAQRHGAGSVVGVLTSICVLRRWVAGHAGELDDGFLRAAGRIVAQWTAAVARDWEGLSDSERDAIADELFGDERTELFFHILGPGDVAFHAADEYRDSITYRVGDALLRAPRFVRDRVRVVRRRNEAEGL